MSGSVEFRVTRQIKRLDHKIDLVGADVSELREEFGDHRKETDRRLSHIEDGMAKVLTSLNRISDKLDKPGA